MTPEEFNQKTFNLLLMFSVFQEFGSTEILMRTDLKQSEKLKIQNCFNALTNFNQHLSKNEESIQFGQDDQTSEKHV